MNTFSVFSFWPLLLYYIASHHIALHYTTLHYITLHYITLHYITLHYITLHYMSVLGEPPLIQSISTTFQTIKSLSLSSDAKKKKNIPLFQIMIVLYLAIIISTAGCLKLILRHFGNILLYANYFLHYLFCLSCSKKRFFYLLENRLINVLETLSAASGTLVLQKI